MDKPTESMEARLQSLIAGNRPENRTKWALEAKGQGKKVIGLLCSYVPPELIYAADMFPWRVTGTWTSDLSKALSYLSPDSCRYCSHVLESLLRGDLEFLDGIVASDWDDNRRRLYDVWCYVAKPQFAGIISAPRKSSELAQAYFAKELSKLASHLEQSGGAGITSQKVWQSIEIYRKMRGLIRKLYDLQRRPKPALSGAELLGITTAAMVMDPKFFNSELEALLPHIGNRDSKRNDGYPRMLISSDALDNPAYLKVIESENCNIAMDDLDTGSRYFWRNILLEAKDPFAALARGYVLGPSCPTAFDWQRQGEQIIQWVGEFKIKGVIELAEEFSPARHWRAPTLHQQLLKAQVLHIQLDRGYSLEAEGRLRTRVGAFLEMLQGA